MSNTTPLSGGKEASAVDGPSGANCRAARLLAMVAVDLEEALKDRKKFMRMGVVSAGCGKDGQAVIGNDGYTVRSWRRKVNLQRRSQTRFYIVLPLTSAQ